MRGRAAHVVDMGTRAQFHEVDHPRGQVGNPGQFRMANNSDPVDTLTPSAADQVAEEVERPSIEYGSEPAPWRWDGASTPF